MFTTSTGKYVTLKVVFDNKRYSAWCSGGELLYNTRKPLEPRTETSPSTRDAEVFAGLKSREKKSPFLIDVYTTAPCWYLSQEEVLDRSNPFVQLVSGVVWLLRNGEVYINQSLQAECDETQETGLFRYFVDVVSARTAVGHNAEGDVILFHIDGQTGVRGMDLWEVAEALKSYGVVNAINLDGGGSSTYVTGGSLASYPSDHCESDSRWRCARPVSTILCVHQPRCRPEDCGPRSVCTANGCVCEAGWRGEECSFECVPGFYGDGCNQSCTCVNGAACDPVHGRCVCPPGFRGDHCEQACPLGFFGPSCANECCCDDQCPCDPQTGSCNATLHGESNHTLHTAGRCLAKQMFIRWRRDEEAHGPRLTERTWLTITSTLASLLLASLLLHLIRGCARVAAAARARRHPDYSYVPLVSVNGAAWDDLDSQEAIWSPGTSSRKSSMRREGQMFGPDLQQDELNSGGSGSAELVNH
ncbi:N-acetylglucosamine-1-phosphodiester alpha-N-acetylglucosaminidase isoform 2-T2 [Spinachia spinachia]